MRRSVLMLATVLTSLILFLTLALAATTGQIKGHIFDKETGEPIVGASVLVVGANAGAMTDPDGFFQILRMDPGTYTLRISHMNYVTVEITDVVVEVDSTSEIKQSMTTKVTELEQTITVVGTHDIQDKFVTDSRKVISQETINTRPVPRVDALLESVAGVQTTAEGEVFVRGGRGGEVAYIIDGVPSGSTVYFKTGSPVVTTPAHGGTAIVNGEPYDAMFFENHGTNPFVDTDDDQFATFAVDVDEPPM